MSVELVEEQVIEFLTNKAPAVIAIQGRWGVGKTHAWNSYVSNHKDSIVVKSYSYVSLFGINSINDIKRTIFEKTIDISLINKPDDFSTLKRNYKSVGKKIGRKSGSALKDLAKPMTGIVLTGLGSSIDKAYESFMLATLNETLICFDDIERHSKQVSLRDFLGLVSYLKEQKLCKIVLLLNEDSQDLEEYLIYKEKVIDKQLHFEPTATQCFDIAIDAEIERYQHVRDVCLRLDIRNIRVLKKIEMHIKIALKATIDFDESIKDTIVQNLIVFCWCHYCHGSDKNNIPSFSFVKSLVENSDIDGLTMSLKSIKGQETELNKETDNLRKKWINALTSYGFSTYEDLNGVILSSVENGYIDNELLIKICNEKQHDINLKHKEKIYSDGWDVFHGSFNDNEEEVIKAMENGLRSAIEQLTALQYGSGISLIRDLGHNELADELTNLYIKTHQDNLEKLNINSFRTNPFGVKDKKFGDELQAFYNSKKDNDSPFVILDRLSDKNSYNPSDVRVLEKLTSDELKDMFKNLSGEELTKKIMACFMLAGSSESLMINLKKALEDIGNESTLNKHRLKKFDIS